MINNDYTITLKSKAESFVEWTTANPNDVSWIFVNGVRKYGPILNDEVDRIASFRFKNDQNKAIDVHDFISLGFGVTSIFEEENTRPLLGWNTVTDATRYRIYHTPFGGSETLIYNQLATLDQQRYQAQSPIILAEGWHLFRIESVDVFGNESTNNAFSYRVFRLPEIVNDLTIVDGSGSGLFNIIIS